MSALPITIAEWPKSRRDTIRVRLDSYEGTPTLCMRVWYAGPHGELRPGRDGLTLGIRHLPDLAQAVQDALAQARLSGLLPPGADNGAS